MLQHFCFNFLFAGVFAVQNIVLVQQLVVVLVTMLLLLLDHLL